MICERKSYNEKEENREGNVRRFVFRKTKIPHEFPPVHLSEYRSVLKGTGDGATDGSIIRESAFIKGRKSPCEPQIPTAIFSRFYSTPSTSGNEKTDVPRCCCSWMLLLLVLVLVLFNPT